MGTTMQTGASLWNLEPSDYVAHPLHGEHRTYRETNCFADVLIELLHARGEEPLAALGYIVRTDWEGDQFTYSKPPLADLMRLYGVEVHEMLPYRSVPEHIETQLRRRRTMLVEIDGWYLPDTEGTSYQREHMKTTIAPEMIDRAAERLRYFHNAGYWELSGEDYRGAFRMLPQFTDDVMDPYIELVDFEAGTPLRGDALRAAARELLAEHYARRPASNPFAAWEGDLADSLEVLLQESVEAFHEYAFVTVRMFGSAFEMLADHVYWALGADGEQAAAEFRTIAEHSAIVSFRLARRRRFDTHAAIAPIIEAWDRGMEHLGRGLGTWS